MSKGGIMFKVDHVEADWSANGKNEGDLRGSPLRPGNTHVCDSIPIAFKNSSMRPSRPVINRLRSLHYEGISI